VLNNRLGETERAEKVLFCLIKFMNTSIKPSPNGEGRGEVITKNYS
jgi:hypothetical protein